MNQHPASLTLASLPQCPLQLVLKRFKQSGDHRPFASLNETLDGHARNELSVPQTREPIGRDGNPNGIEALTCTLIGAYVGGDSSHLAVDLGSSRNIECRKAQHRLLVQLNLLDILRVDP